VISGPLYKINKNHDRLPSSSQTKQQTKEGRGKREDTDTPL
jgi:hypothetical protein